MANLSVFLLSALVPWAVYAVGIFAYQNGFYTHMQDAIAARRLPPSGEPLMTEFTGIPVIDEVAMNFIPFFYAVVDGNSPGLTLHCVNFIGEVTAVWTLVCIESMRIANKGRLITLPAIFGFFVQTFTFALTMPVYTVIHLLTSPTTQAPSRGGISVPHLKLKVLPFSLTLGAIVPSLLMVLPETSSGILRTTQDRIVFWQPWPFWVSIVQFVSGIVLTIFCSSASASSTEPSSTRKTRSSLRHVYGFALICATVPHVAAWTISLASSIVPTLFNPKILPSIHPATVFVNTLPWSSATASSVAEGTLWFAQYDHLISAVATLIWTITLWRTAHAAKGVRPCTVGLVVRVVVLCLVTGVAGAAVVIMWERDELLLEGEDQEPRQKKVK